MEQTKISATASIARARNILHPNFRYVWGDFEALSYTWGNQDDTKKITVNGVDMKVPRNLGEALKALRDLNETRLGMCYWVDSLSINQNDEDEKKTQIKRMRDIYSQARAVVAWLGQAESEDELAVETMHHLCHNPDVKESLSLPEYLLLDGGPALLAFIKKKYWTRSWIIQELAMNHNSTLILCGSFMLTRIMIRLATNYCQELLQADEELSDQPEHDIDFDAWPSASRVRHLMSLAFKPSARGSLNHLLSLVRGADAEIAKEKIYSIMGLLDSAISEDIQPDYSPLVSDQQVYTDFIISVINRPEGLQQIMLGGIPTSEGWPSWVSDWRKRIKRHHTKRLACRKASGDLPTKFRYLGKGKNDQLLACSGYRVDEIDGITTDLSSNLQYTQSSSTSNRYGDQISEALEQTLIMNHPERSAELLPKIP